METLTRLEKNFVCQAIGEYVGKEEKKFEKIKERLHKGEKSIYIVGEGREDLNMAWNRTYKTIDTLIKASKKIGCY